MDRDRVLETFTADRPRLVRLATRILADPAEAEDIVQQAWLRLDRADTPTIDSPGAWLTTVVTRLCLDRLKARVPVPVADDTGDGRPAVSADDPADDVVLADSVGAALHVVVDRLSPTESVAFVLHDSFGVEFATIAEILDCTPAAARKLASRARARVGGDGVRAPTRRTGRRVRRTPRWSTPSWPPRATALPVHVDDRPGAAWFDRGTARVVFDFQVAGGVVTRIDFRAEERVLRGVRRRRRTGPVTSGAPESSEE